MESPKSDQETTEGGRLEIINPTRQGEALHLPSGQLTIQNSEGSQSAIIYSAQVVHIYNSVTPVVISEKEKELKISEFIADVNKETNTKSESSIAKDVDNEVPEPKEEETPVLVATNFFRGESALDEVDYSVTEERGRKKVTKRAREVQVPLPDVHKHGRYIMLVGGAGSGKTTLIKRYCKAILEKKIENMEHIIMVCLINIRDMPDKEELTPKEMLFEKLIVGAHKKDSLLYGFEWMQKEENQDKILLAFDGIDTAPWFLTRETHDLKSYDDKCRAATLMYNILYGQLFRKCPLLVTSREHGIAKFPRGIRPDKIIALKGFTRKSIESLVKQLGGDGGMSIWNTLKQKSLNLMLLCSTPLFLIFTIIVYKNQDDPPENLSGIIITLLERHIHLESSRVKDDEVREIIEKLKALSKHGLLKGKVVFTEDEFRIADLNLKDITDLMIRVPAQHNAKNINQRLLAKDYSYFFCHQALQEALAGLCIAGEKYDEFKAFVDNYLHLPKFTVVRQILCGVIFNPETTSLAESQAKIPDKERKMTYLRKTLAEELDKHKDSSINMLNLLISLRECGQEEEIVKMIKNKIPKLSLSGIPLTPSDLHAAATVAKQCDHLSIMQLVNCHLDNYALEVLANGMKGSCVEITVFDVSFNRNLRKDSMFHLHEICIRGQGLNYWQCGFRQIDILNFNERESQTQVADMNEPSEKEMIRKSFKEGLLDMACYNIETYPEVLQSLITEEKSPENDLRLSLVEYEPETNVTTLCDLLRKIDVIQELAISESEFSGTQLEQIKLAIQGKKIETLNIFLNPNIKHEGWRVLGEICKVCHVKNLFITACSLTEEKLKSLKFSLCGTKLFKFDISRNDNMDDSCLRQIGEIVDKCEVKELVMGYCNFTAGQMKFLKRSVCDAKINRIDISGNDQMGEGGFKALGEIVLKCKVQLLDASECDPNAAEVREFKKAVHDAKIKKLNMSRNRHMGVQGLQDIGELVGTSQPVEVFIRQCELEENTLRAFKEGLRDAKIPFLDFGFYFMKPRKTTERELEIIIGLIPNVTKQLTLNDWDIDEKGRRDLQRAIDALPYIDLKIMFNRGNNDFIRQHKP